MSDPWAQEVNFDPELPYLFMGEELLYSARLWTHGWRIFTPVSSLVYHHYGRTAGKSVFADHNDAEWSAAVAATHAKAMYLLGLSQEPPVGPLATNLSRYGMGPAATAQQYLQFAGIDAARNVSHADDKFCGDRPYDLVGRGEVCLARLAGQLRAEEKARRGRRWRASRAAA